YIVRSLAESLDRGVKKIGMTRIDASFDGLKIIRFLEAFRDIAVGLGNARPLELRQFRNVVAGPHVRPNESSIFARRIGSNSHFILESVFRRLIRHVHAYAFGIVFPTVINAPQPAVFVATPEKAGTSMRTEFIEQSHAAARVSEGNQIFAEKAHANRGTIGSR